jgi:hypothetical protein
VIQNSHSQVDVEVPAEAADFNSIYEEALMNLKTRKPAVPKGFTGVVTAAEKERAAKDYYASVRTNVRRLIGLFKTCVNPMAPGFVTLGVVKCMFSRIISLLCLTIVHWHFHCRACCWLVSSAVPNLLTLLMPRQQAGQRFILFLSSPSPL